MPWKDTSETFVGQDGGVFAGAVGSTLPTSAVAVPAVAFSGFGYNNEDGIRFSHAREVNRLRSFQELSPTRIIPGEETVQLGFVFQQWNEVTLPAALGGGTISNPSGSIWKYVPRKAGDPLDERAWIADIIDGARHLRIIIPRGIVVETTEVQFQRSGYAELPVTVEALIPADGSEPYHFYSDDAAAFAAGS